MAPRVVTTTSRTTAYTRFVRMPNVNVVNPAEYTDRWFDNNNPPNAAIRYGTAIHGGSMSRIAATGSPASANVGSPADSRLPNEISSTNGMPAPAAADATSDPARTEGR